MTFYGDDYLEALEEYIDMDQIPQYLGGRNKTPLHRDVGPWNDFETVNPHGNPD